MAAVQGGTAADATKGCSGSSPVVELIGVKQGVPTLVAPAVETQKGFKYFLSNVDQALAGFTVRVVYCFKAEGKGNEEAAEVVRGALAKVLVHYYPLAGRLAISSEEERLVVDCTGEGAVFVETDADCNLKDIGDVNNPNPVALGKLFYSVPGAENVLGTPLLVAQVTRFKCGGFTLGVTINHSMVDGTSITDFMKSWGETARGLPLSVPPFLDRTILRARVPPKIEYVHQEFKEIEDVSDMATLCEGEYLVRSFCFDPEAVEQVKRRATEDGILHRGCTTFEAVAGFVWQARTKAMRMRPHQQTRLLCVADVRRRLNPSLPSGYFGNGIVLANWVGPAAELLERPLSFAVGAVQEAVRAVTSSYVRSVVDYLEATRAEASWSPVTHVITTWSRLPFHAADFGWGEPLQCGPPAPVCRDFIMFLPRGKDSNSITVLLGLPSTAMVTFQELLMQVLRGDL